MVPPSSHVFWAIDVLEHLNNIACAVNALPNTCHENRLEEHIVQHGGFVLSTSLNDREQIWSVTHQTDMEIPDPKHLLLPPYLLVSSIRARLEMARKACKPHGQLSFLLDNKPNLDV